MKEIKTMDELNAITGQEPSIIKFGQPNCIPCKMTQENLNNFEKNNKFNLIYYECSDINIITKLGYNAVPVIMLLTPHKKIELTDSSIAMDEDDLENWITTNLE